MKWKLILPACAVLFVMVGCAPTSHFGVSDKAMTCPVEFDQTEAVIARAEQSEGAKYCPEKIARAKELGKEAMETYWSGCPCEAVALLAEARRLAEEAQSCQPPARVSPPPPAPKDSDGDGIFDSKDRCPNTPRGATVNAEGCWVIPAVLFDTDKTEIKDMYRLGIDRVIVVLKNNPGAKMEVQGHTDNQASAAYNQRLSERRAKAVKDYMVAEGISPSRLITKGYGFSRPVATNDNATGRAQNRRVELALIN
jgi:outer membrane protein OmpA-like peptidoglycan-associated protein